MKKIKFDKNTILIICLIITFLFLFSIYIFSLVRKNHLRTHGEKESSQEKEILEAKDDPMYNAYCQGEVKYTTNGASKRGGLGYVHNITITITNNSENTYTTWTIKIPSNKVTVEKVENASFYYNNGAAYINSLGSFEKLSPGESIMVNASISTEDNKPSDYFKYLVLTDCTSKNSNIISSGNAKLSLGEMEVELTPELTVEKIENDETTYALYLRNSNTTAVKNPRLVLYQDQGSFISLSTFNITENKGENTVTAIDLNEPDNMINRGYTSQKYLLVLKDVPSGYKPDIVASGTKVE